MDTAANNLANVGTTGFRAQHDYFRGVLAGGIDTGVQGGQGSQVGNSVNGYGVLGGNSADLSQGPMVTTSNPLDMAINGPGYFAIKTAQGTRYTRDGSFTRGVDGTLQTGSGEPVLDTTGKPIVLPSGAVEISPDGTISVTTATGAGVVGQVGRFDFANPLALQLEGTNRYSADGLTATVADGEIKQGAIEGSNQDAVHGTMQLVLVQRQAEMMQRALSVFNNDFDKTAVEQISRV